MNADILKAVRDWCLSKFQQKDDYALLSDIPKKTSELTNDRGFLTEMPAATQSRAGAVKPDGTTIVISADGTISAVGGGGTGSSGPIQILEDPVNGLGLLPINPEDILEVEEEN